MIERHTRQRDTLLAKSRTVYIFVGAPSSVLSVRPTRLNARLSSPLDRYNQFSRAYFKTPLLNLHNSDNLMQFPQKFVISPKIILTLNYYSFFDFSKNHYKGIQLPNAAGLSGSKNVGSLVETHPCIPRGSSSHS